MHTEHLRHLGLSDCASVMFAPDSDRVICVPFLQHTESSAPLVRPNSVENFISRPLDRERHTSREQQQIDDINLQLEQNTDSADQQYASREASITEDGSQEDESAEHRGSNLDRCNETDDLSDTSKGSQCLGRKNTRDEQRKPPPPYTYYLTIKRDGSLSSNLGSVSRGATESETPKVLQKHKSSFRHRYDHSKPAILISTQGRNYKPSRRHSGTRLQHRSDLGVDLDGGQQQQQSGGLSELNRGSLINSMAEIRRENEKGSEEGANTANSGEIELEQSLECNKRQYRFKASKRDGDGNKCSGLVTATICYGSCDTGEIADWLFPHKKSIHKVCSHGLRVRRRALLTECSSDSVEPSLREYHYVDAKTCVCQKCNSADTTCLGSLTRPYLAPLPDGLELGGGGSNTNGGNIDLALPESTLVY